MIDWREAESGSLRLQLGIADVETGRRSGLVPVWSTIQRICPVLGAANWVSPRGLPLEAKVAE